MLKAKVALITGSTSGIGLGIARGLAQSGAHIVLNGFGDRSEIEELRAGIQSASDVEVIYNAADMSKPDEIVEMITETQKTLGSVDIVVNNAGIQKVAPIEEFPVDKWDAIIAINLSSAFHTIRTAIPLMKARGWGRIVNIGSAHSLVASPFKSAYVAAKHGMLGSPRPWRWRSRRPGSPAMRSARATSGRRWSKADPRIPPRRGASPRNR